MFLFCSLTTVNDTILLDFKNHTHSMSKITKRKYVEQEVMEFVLPSENQHIVKVSTFLNTRNLWSHTLTTLQSVSVSKSWP